MKMASFSNPAGIPLPKDMAVNPMVVETAVEIIPDHVQYERMFKWETDYARVVMFSSIEDESVQKHLVDKYPLSEYNYKGCHAQLLPFLPRQHKSAEKPVAVKVGDRLRYVAIFRRKARRGEVLHQPLRDLKFYKMVLPMFFKTEGTLNVNANGMDFVDFHPYRRLPDESIFDKLSILYCGYYFSNAFEKIMLQTIKNEVEMYDRLSLFYQTIAVVGALIAGIAVGAYLQGLTFNHYSSDSVNLISFCYGALMAGSSFFSLTGALLSTVYYLTLLSTPPNATDEFIEANLSVPSSISPLISFTFHPSCTKYLITLPPPPIAATT
mmetsp:Transcript_12844/g.28521  ORF Transcript_12844/g.28521 Transcript_12844/m.28521 type:complete len:324 (-) Transcript_12844:984-1955(-)